MNGKPIATLPDPPDHLSEEASRTWIEAGVRLLRAERLTERTLEKLSDLCYWEDQKSSVMQKLRTDQAAGMNMPGRKDRSIFLKNLKAISLEIRTIRNDLGLEGTDSPAVSDTPFITEEAYKSLPKLLQNCCNRVEGEEKKALLLLSMLPLTAAQMPNMLAEHANGYYTPSLNIFLIDGSGAGKQLANKIETLALGDHKADARQKGTAVRSLLEELIDTNKGSGSGSQMRVVVESDLERVFSDDSLYTEAGRYKRLFRDGFTPVPMVIEPNRGTLSSLIIGDTGQFRKLSLNAGPDLFSLFMLYAGRTEKNWQSNRPSTSTRALSKDLAELASELAGIRSVLADRKEPITVELASNQWQMIDDTFAEKMDIINELGLPDELHSVNRKTAIYTLKLASIFTVMRSFYDDPGSLKGEYLTPHDDDVIAALWIADTCLKHAIRLHEILPGSNATDARGARYLKYYNILPGKFETADALEVADKMDIPPRTAKRYLNSLIDEKKVSRLKRGLYKKMG